MLQVKIEGNEIVIRMPFDALKTAYTYSPKIENMFDGDLDAIPKITDLEIFAESVIEGLTVEREDGSNFIFDAFDEAFEYVLEQGLEGLSE